MTLRHLMPIPLLLSLTACSGLGHFFGDTMWLDSNPNAPAQDSENISRASGKPSDASAMRQEAGDVWPKDEPAPPTLADIANHPNHYPPPDVALPVGAPHAQPRPATDATPYHRLPSVKAAPGEPADSAAASSPESFHIITKKDGSSGGVAIPNGNGTVTIIAPDGKVTTVPSMPH